MLNGVLLFNHLKLENIYIKEMKINFLFLLLI